MSLNPGPSFRKLKVDTGCLKNRAVWMAGAGVVQS